MSEKLSEGTPSPATPAKETFRHLAERTMSAESLARATPEASLRELALRVIQLRDSGNDDGELEGVVNLYDAATSPEHILELLDEYEASERELESLRSALREAQEDAERFVWIRDHAQSGLVPSGDKTVHRWTFDLPYRMGVSTDWLREGIDAAARETP